VKPGDRGQEQSGLLPFIQHGIVWPDRGLAGDAGDHDIVVPGIQQNQSRSSLDPTRVCVWKGNQDDVPGSVFGHGQGRS